MVTKRTEFKERKKLVHRPQYVRRRFYYKIRLLSCNAPNNLPCIMYICNFFLSIYCSKNKKEFSKTKESYFSFVCTVQYCILQKYHFANQNLISRCLKEGLLKHHDLSKYISSWALSTTDTNPCDALRRCR